MASATCSCLLKSDIELQGNFDNTSISITYSNIMKCFHWGTEHGNIMKVGERFNASYEYKHLKGKNENDTILHSKLHSCVITYKFFKKIILFLVWRSPQLWSWIPSLFFLPLWSRASWRLASLRRPESMDCWVCK